MFIFLSLCFHEFTECRPQKVFSLMYLLLLPENCKDSEGQNTRFFVQPNSYNPDFISFKPLRFNRDLNVCEKTVIEIIPHHFQTICVQILPKRNRSVVQRTVVWRPCNHCCRCLLYTSRCV